MATLALKYTILTNSGESLFCVSKRFAGGSPGQSQGKRRLLKLLGLKVPVGCEVQERDIIVNQRGIKYHPGLNVGIDPRDNALFSHVDGTLIVTTEKFSPKANHELVRKYYSNMSGNIYKRYVHVIPKKTEKVFKLIDQV